MPGYTCPAIFTHIHALGETADNTSADPAGRWLLRLPWHLWWRTLLGLWHLRLSRQLRRLWVTLLWTVFPVSGEQLHRPNLLCERQLLWLSELCGWGLLLCSFWFQKVSSFSPPGSWAMLRPLRETFEQREHTTLRGRRPKPSRNNAPAAVAQTPWPKRLWQRVSMVTLKKISFAALSCAWPVPLGLA